MKSQLSAAKYIRNNKRTGFVLILALGLTFMAMYVIAYLLYTTSESTKPICFELPRKIVCCSLSTASLGVNYDDYEDVGQFVKAREKARTNLTEKLSSDPDVIKAYYTQVLYASYNGVVGGIGYEFPLLPPEEVPFVVKHLGAELVEGRMPEGEGEVLIDERVMKNGGMKLGGWFQQAGYGEVFKIVGVLRSDCMGCVGTPRGGYNSGVGFVVLCNDNSNNLRELLAKYGVTVSQDNGDNIYDVEDYRNLYEEDIRKTIDDVINVILLTVMVFLSISVVVAYVSFMRNRVGEYCLYASIGYSRSDIYGMMMREMLVMFIAGILLGAVTTVGMVALFRGILIEPRGLSAQWFMKEQLLRILGSFACIVGVLQIPMAVTVQKIKTIDLMED